MSPLTIVYIVTGIIGIATALFLAQMAARMSSRTALDTGIKGKKLSLDAAAEDGLRQTILKEVGATALPRQQSHEIANRLSSVLSRELEKKVAQTEEELSHKYETIIKEKDKNEEIAWRKYEKVLTDKKETEAVIRSIAEGLVVVDASGKVVMMNPAAEKLLGVSRKDKIGKPVLDNLKEEQLVSLSRESPAGHDGREIELVSRQDETKKVLRASTAVIENENGHTVGMVSVLSDITKQKELDRLKANFVASVSHELRTPLVAIDKSISLMLNKNAGEITETQEQFLNIAARNLKRLSVLVNDLLDLSKLEAGRMEIRRKPTAVDALINESVAGLANWAKTKLINLEAKIQAGLAEADIDPDRTMQVLNNLIGNAIKFTPANGTITIEAKSESQDWIEVSVRDTGIGIAKDNLGKVFDKFYQVGERVSSDINGTGIGLSIAKEIVELHGGRIWAESEQGEGARFVFTIPVKKQTAGPDTGSADNG
ncbi:MAG: ATP-binding protein [Candidatus Omnitrophota bacterium]